METICQTDIREIPSKGYGITPIALSAPPI